MTPEQINAAVAELDGWKIAACHVGKNIPANLLAWERGSKCVMTPKLPDYYHSVDCVLPLLEKHAFRFEGGKAIGCQYVVVIAGSTLFHKWGLGGWYQAIAPTFAAAACLALLKSVGVEVGEAEGKDL
jgi:hypothetical protein